MRHWEVIQSQDCGTWVKSYEKGLSICIFDTSVIVEIKPVQFLVTHDLAVGTFAELSGSIWKLSGRMVVTVDEFSEIMNEGIAALRAAQSAEPVT